MKQSDVAKTIGWAGAAAGAALAVGYFLQPGAGSKRWKSLSRGMRGMVDSASEELTKLGRDMGIIDASRDSHSTSSRSRRSGAKADALVADSGSGRKGSKSSSKGSSKKSGSKRSRKSS